MMKHEFEERIGHEIKDKDYKVIEYVYNFHPVIKDKDQIAKIFKIGGMVVIRDMLQTATKYDRIESAIRKLRGMVDTLIVEETNLLGGDEVDMNLVDDILRLAI